MNPHCKFEPIHAAPCRTLFPASRALTVSCALFVSLFAALPAANAQTPKPSPAVPSQTSTSLADQPPTAATVSFQSGKLTVHAHNSELLQILQSIAAQTGMKVQGRPGQHRVFGVYGPAEPREVLNQILSGFGFNYLLVGTSPNGAPQKLILAGTAGLMPQPSQPTQSVQPAPQNTLPQPQPGPRPAYQPHQSQLPRRTQPPSRSSRGAQSPQHVRTPQQILKELEAMHAKQKQNSSQ